MNSLGKSLAGLVCVALEDQLRDQLLDQPLDQLRYQLVNQITGPFEYQLRARLWGYLTPRLHNQNRNLIQFQLQKDIDELTR